MTALDLMLHELESSRLEVVLIPSKRKLNEWDQCRCVVAFNCVWYRRLCSEHASKRGVRRGKFDTRIKRAGITRVLTRMVNGQPTKSKYAPELRKISAKHKIPR